jgi:hypothetical protein
VQVGGWRKGWAFSEVHAWAGGFRLAEREPRPPAFFMVGPESAMCLQLKTASSFVDISVHRHPVLLFARSTLITPVGVIGTSVGAASEQV